MTMAAQGEDTFPQHIWSNILGHLKKPVPPPLSAPPRSELHSPELLCAARTCKLFHSIATPLIYKIVVVDELLPFLYLHNAPARRNLFKHTEKLFIEYRDKQPFVPYDRLMGHGDTYWDYIGGTEDDVWREAVLMMECDMEVCRYIVILEELATWPVREVFPSLRTIAVASIYGRQTDIWSRYDRYKEAQFLPSAIERAVNQWECVLSTCGIENVCIRDMGGPLALRPITPPNEHVKYPDPAYTVHFDADFDLLCIRPGETIRWVSDIPLHTDFYPTFQRITGVFVSLTHSLGQYFVRGKDEAVHLGLYFSSNYLGTPVEGVPNILPLSKIGIKMPPKRRLTGRDQRTIAEKLSNACTSAMQAVTKQEDVFEWYPSGDCKECEACGSRPPA